MNYSISLLQTSDYKAKLNQCIHCGMCLEACPTYAVFGTEMDGPRGRIALMRAASDGRIEIKDFSGAVSTHLNRCLACRACETACPSGVQYSSLLEPVRLIFEQSRRPGPGESMLRWLGLRQLMPHQRRLRLLARLLYLYQKTGLQTGVRQLNMLPKTLTALESILPPLSLQFRKNTALAQAHRQQHGRVAFFTGCIQDAFLSQVNKATVRVLQQNGYEVHIIPNQTCCGAAHTHSGDEQTARKLARQNIDSFAAEKFDAIINNAGGCGLMLKEYPQLLADDSVYAEAAKEFAANVQDISEFLADHLNFPPHGTVNMRVTYSDSCHLRHGQKVVWQPRHLLHQIPGLELVELNQPDRCCGSAGIYNIAQPDTAQIILNDKMADVASTNATVIVTSNTGCHLQLVAGARQAGLQTPVMHVVELLDKSYEVAGQKQSGQ
jgi:glycolate oxidase iron-sulfur subunit